MCTDHPVVHTMVGRIEDRRIVTYGENPQADVRLTGLEHADGMSRFAVVFRDRAGSDVHTIDNLTLPMPGRHNALNATAAIAVAHHLGISDDLIRKALSGFGGVRRRFTRTGAWNGITVIDDYGHHPVEIAAVLRAARESVSGQVIAVVQPHRYTRLQSLFEAFCTCFNDAAAPGTMWSVSAPAASPNGPMRCRANLRRSAPRDEAPPAVMGQLPWASSVACVSARYAGRNAGTAYRWTDRPERESGAGLIEPLGKTLRGSR
jgi:hypothetical protein